MDNSTAPSNENMPGRRPGVVHSTHSYLETFDQVTREQGNSLDKDDSNTTLSSKGDPWHHPSSEKEANTAVQFDRDIQQSRRMSEADRQKASGNSRSSSFSSNGLSYIE